MTTDKVEEGEALSAVSEYDDSPVSSEWGEPPLPFDERLAGSPLLDDDVERGFFVGGGLTVILSIVWRGCVQLLPIEESGWMVRSSQYFAPQWVGCIVVLTLINLRSWKTLVGLLVDTRREDVVPISTFAFGLRTSMLIFSKAISLLLLVYILHGANSEQLASILVGFTLCLFFGSFCLLLR